MPQLKVPSLQHLARNWDENPQVVKELLIKLVDHPPNFSYSLLFELTRDLVVLRQPLEEVLKAVRLRVKRDDVRGNFLELLPLINEYFLGAQPSYVHTVEGRFYPIGQDLLVPFNPPLVYGSNGKLILPWLSFWRSHPLSGEKLSLFVTAVKEMLSQSPDLESAQLQILDFSAPKKGAPRKLNIVDARDIPILSENRKHKMFASFAEGLLSAREEIATRKGKDDKNVRAPLQNEVQVNLFPED